MAKVIHSGQEALPAMPEDPKQTDETLARTNDPTALNGGPSRHWFRPGRDESFPTPRRAAKVGVAIALWGSLFVGVVALSALI